MSAKPPQKKREVPLLLFPHNVTTFAALNNHDTIMRKIALILLSTILVLSSCSKENTIDIQSLEGSWYEYNTDPNFVSDGSVNYTFYGDNSLSLVTGGYGGELTQESGTYEISNDHKLITLYLEGDFYAQYNIIRLNSKEMVWKSITYDQTTGKQISRYFAKNN